MQVFFARYLLSCLCFDVDEDKGKGRSKDLVLNDYFDSSFKMTLNGHFCWFISFDSSLKMNLTLNGHFCWFISKCLSLDFCWFGRSNLRVGTDLLWALKMTKSFYWWFMAVLRLSLPLWVGTALLWLAKND